MGSVIFEKIPWRRKWQPLQSSCLENSTDRGAWRATVHGVAESDMTEQLTHTQKHHIKGQKWLRILIYNWVKLREWVCVFVCINLWVCMERKRGSDGADDESSVQFSHSVVSASLWPHEPQHARPPCPSQIPGVHPNPCPSSQWCHPAISSPSPPALNLSRHQDLFQ